MMPKIPQSEFCQRRENLANQMQDGSALIVFSAKEVTRNADSHYLFRQNSYFWYLTGFDEPDAALVMIKSNSKHFHTILFNRTRDLEAEIWNGRRLGQDAALSVLGVDRAFSIDEIQKQLPLLLNGLNYFYHAVDMYDFADKIVFESLDTLRNGFRQSWTAPNTLIDWRPMLDNMRLIKSVNEINLLKMACEITAKGHMHAMKTCQVGMTEAQLQAEIEYVFRKEGAKTTSYNSIVGSGVNACILHYTENESPLTNQQLVLIDAGAEYQNYAGDITRTFPINGRFTKAQREIYDLVLKMQLTAFEYLKPGGSIFEANQQAVKVLVEGLLDLGILVGDLEALIKANAHREFYMHGLSHWLGLDVHDVGCYGSVKRDRILEPGMVLTVEPGIYIQPDAKKVPAEYLGIGVRIEDDIVITQDGYQVLTAIAIKDPDEIEAFMQKANA